jgi:crotonobetainyl-CoA:carnitine CoA-transferase CaiB-like acyl-CoA transferase
VNDSLHGWRYEDLRRLVQDELGGTIVPMNRSDTLIEGEQMVALDMVRTLQGHPTAGPYRTLNVPWTFDEELASLRLPAPQFGQHTAEVLSGLGYDGDAIQQLATAGTIKVSDS